MTLPYQAPIRHSKQLPAPENGWYIYSVGQEIRCPAPDDHKKAGIATTCGRYLGTVTQGVTCVRAEMRLHEGLERRQHPRFTTKCQRCGTPLEIETRGTPQAAA